MSSTQYVYSKQQFISDVSFNSALTVAGATTLSGTTTVSGSATFTSANTIINGNVGIGTTNPSTKIHVIGNPYNSANNAHMDIEWGDFHTTSYMKMGNLGTDDNAYNSGALYMYQNSTTTAVKLSANGNSYLNGGNVGIGTTNPSTKLHVRSGTGTYPRFETDTDAIDQYSGIEFGIPAFSSNKRAKIISKTGNNDSSDLRFCTNTTNGTTADTRMIITKDGNVGIGITNPGNPLDVNGNIRSQATNAFIFQESPGSDWGSLSLQAGYNVTTSNTTKMIVNGWVGGNGNDGTIQFCTMGNERARVHSNGFVGIGTAIPNFPLHIRNGANKYVQFGAHYYISSIGNYSVGTEYDWNTGYINIYTGLYVQDGGIYTDWGINARNLYVFSDKRIKTNIVDIDDNNALSILRQIQPKTYDYVDKLKRGNANVIGFIAQEVKAILPNAVSITKDYIPNFMTVCQVSATDASNIVLVNSPIDLSWNPLHDQSGNAFVDADGNACSDADGNKVFNVKLYDQSNNENTCKTTSILDKRSFLMDVTGSKMVDASGNLVLEADGGYFLHGQEVDDFHNLDKQAIFTVVTAAVQDMDRQVQAQAVKQQADEAQIQAQEVKIAELENKNAALEALVATQSQQIAQQQAQINAILAKIGGV